jgi:outer membrane protein OmpU
VQEHRLRLNFNVAVTSDHGLSFGAWTRAQIGSNGRGANATGVFSGSTVWVEASGVRLQFGNQDGAIASTYVGFVGIGYTGGTFTGNTGFLGSSGIHEVSSTGAGVANLAQLSYTMGGLRVALSHSRGGHSEIAARYTFDAFSVAAGTTINSPTGTELRTISARYNAGGWSASVIAVRDLAGENGLSLTGSAALGGGTASAYIGRLAGETYSGLGYSYGLGGGASLAAGVERIPAGTRANIGVVFNF